MREHGLRVRVDGRALFLDSDRSGHKIDRFEVADAGALAAPEIGPNPELSVLLRVAVAVHGTPVRAIDPTEELQPRERRPFVHQILVTEFDQSEKLPPRRLCFAPVPFQ